MINFIQASELDKNFGGMVGTSPNTELLLNVSRFLGLEGYGVDDYLVYGYASAMLTAKQVAQIVNSKRLDAPTMAVHDTLTDDPISIDLIAQKSGVSISETSGCLGLLEIAELVTREKNMTFKLAYKWGE